MKVIISGKNFSLTDSIKDYIEDKLQKLDKYFTPEMEAKVTLGTQKNRMYAEITIPSKGVIFRAEQGSTDMYVSIDLTVDVLERQIRKYKSRIVEKHRADVNFSESFLKEENPLYDSGDIRISRTKRIDLIPMDPEEACMQMELLGHDFYVFYNMENEMVNVIYKRKDGSYGLIETTY